MCRLEEGPAGTHSTFLLEGAQTQSHRRQERLRIWMHSAATRIDLLGEIKTHDKKRGGNGKRRMRDVPRRANGAQGGAIVRRERHSEEHPIIPDERVQYPSNRREEKHACSAVSSAAPRSSTLQPYLLLRISTLNSVGHHLNPSASPLPTPAIHFIL